MMTSEAVRSASWQWWDCTLRLGLMAVVSIVALVIALRIRGGEKRKGKRGSKFPPGPRPWPIVGNLGELGPLIHQDLARLADKYGPVLGLRLGSVLTIVVSSPKLAEEVLKTNDRVFASRPRTASSRILSYNNESVTFAPYGPYWRHVRKVFTLELFTARRMQSFSAARTEEVLRTLHSVLAECEDGTAAVSLKDKFGELAWNITSRMFINRSIFPSSKPGTDSNGNPNSGGEYGRVHKVFNDLVRLSGGIVLGDYVPLLRGFDVRGLVRQMWETRGRMDDVLDDIIAEHRRELSLSPGPRDREMDVVDVLLTRPGEDDEKPLTSGQIKGILKDGFVAGTDTTAGTLGWAMAELVRNPRVLERAQAELDEVVGRHRLAEESDLPHLPYLRAVVKETFRLHPVGPLLLPHESVTDCEVGGHCVPAGTRLFVNVWAIGRDASVWDRALEFMPERYLGTEMDVAGQDFELLPFGSGRRSCPGKALGLLVVQYALAVHLHACDWSLPRGMAPQDVDLSEAPGAAMPLATPLHLVATLRLPPSALPPLP